MTDIINILQGTQSTPPPGLVPLPRVDQTMILKKSIKPRHFETGLFAIHFCSSTDVAGTDGTVYPVLFSTDDNKLHCYNGTTFVSVTLS